MFANSEQSVKKRPRRAAGARTDAQVDALVEALAESVAHLRKLSPAYV